MFSAARLYIIAGLLAAALAVAGGLYAKGRLDARHASELSQLQRALKASEDTAKHIRLARELDALRASKAAEKAAALNTKIEEVERYVDTLEDANRVCLTGPDTDRLRDLWGHPSERR